MGKDTDDKNLALTAVLLAKQKDKQKKFIADEMTGPFQLQQDAPIVSTDRSIRKSIPTYGALLLIASLIFGGYQAFVAIVDRIELYVNKAINAHSNNTNAHNDLREQIKLNSDHIEKKHKEIITKVDRIIESISRKRRR